MTTETEDKTTQQRFATRVVHAGEVHNKPYGALTTPIVQTSTYTFESSAQVVDHMKRKNAELPLLRGEYGRYIPDGDDDLIGRAEIGNKYIAVWNPRAYEDARIIHYNAVDPDFDPEIAINQLMELLGIQL